VYTSSGASFTAEGVGSSLPDYRIAPDPGSHNPWQQPTAPGGRYRITLRLDVSPGQVNVLPLAPTGTVSGVGYVVYRVYLPADGDFSKLPLPIASIQAGGSTQILPVCATHTAPLPVLPTAATAATTTQPGVPSPSRARPGPLQFYKPAFTSYFPNGDTAYLLARLTPPPPLDVVVVTGMAPTFAPGDHPSPWPASSEQLRYWSMCVNVGTATEPVVVNRLPGGQTDTGCRADEATALDSHGDYTYVIGTEAQRAEIERAAAAAAVMAAYYPRARICALSILAAGGPQACV